MGEQRPDWVRCIGFDNAVNVNGKLAWCDRGERPFFVGPSHAALNGLHGQRLVACRECVQRITEALKSGHDDPEYQQGDSNAE